MDGDIQIPIRNMTAWVGMWSITYRWYRDSTPEVMLFRKKSDVYLELRDMLHNEKEQELETVSMSNILQIRENLKELDDSDILYYLNEHFREREGHVWVRELEVQ